MDEAQVPGVSDTPGKFAIEISQETFKSWTKAKERFAIDSDEAFARLLLDLLLVWGPNGSSAKKKIGDGHRNSESSERAGESQNATESDVTRTGQSSDHSTDSLLSNNEVGESTISLERQQFGAASTSVYQYSPDRPILVRRQRPSHYMNYTPQQRVAIATYAIEHGISKAARHFTEVLARKINESSIRSIKKTYLWQLQNKRVKPRGRPVGALNFESRLPNTSLTRDGGNASFTKKGMLTQEPNVCSNKNGANEELQSHAGHSNSNDKRLVVDQESPVAKRRKLKDQNSNNTATNCVRDINSEMVSRATMNSPALNARSDMADILNCWPDASALLTPGGEKESSESSDKLENEKLENHDTSSEDKTEANLEIAPSEVVFPDFTVNENDTSCVTEDDNSVVKTRLRSIDSEHDIESKLQDLKKSPNADTPLQNCVEKNIRRRGRYNFYKPEEKDNMARYALEHGSVKAAKYFSELRGRQVNESTIRNFLSRFKSRHPAEYQAVAEEREKIIKEKAEEKIARMLNSKKRKYASYSTEQRIIMARFALENGVMNARRHFSELYGKEIAESTVRSIRNSYVWEVENQCVKRRGRPVGSRNRHSSDEGPKQSYQGSSPYSAQQREWIMSRFRAQTAMEELKDRGVYPGTTDPFEDEDKELPEDNSKTKVKTNPKQEVD